MISFEAMEIMHQVKLGETVVAVGHHLGYDIDPDHLTNADEKELVRHLSPRKRSEWLASRELLQLIARLPERASCVYDDLGKPHLLNSGFEISISHSENWCAAMVSKKLCGVDIQVYSDTVRRISSRFVGKDELARTDTFSDPLHQLHFLWGAKECMYKAYGKRKLEFKEHILIKSINMADCHALGEIVLEGLHLHYDIQFRMLPEAAWVFCMQRHPSTAPPGQ